MFSVKAFPGNCKVKKILALLSSFLISIFALNFLHKLFHSSGHGSPVFNEEKYYPPLCDEGKVEDEVVSNPAHVPGPRHVSNAQLATMSSQARWRYQARSHLEHIFWYLTHRHVPPSNLYMSDLDFWLKSTPF